MVFLNGSIEELANGVSGSLTLAISLQHKNGFRFRCKDEIHGPRKLPNTVKASELIQPNCEEKKYMLNC